MELLIFLTKPIHRRIPVCRCSVWAVKTLHKLRELLPVTGVLEQFSGPPEVTQWFAWVSEVLLRIFHLLDSV